MHLPGFDGEILCPQRGKKSASWILALLLTISAAGAPLGCAGRDGRKPPPPISGTYKGEMTEMFNGVPQKSPFTITITQEVYTFTGRYLTGNGKEGTVKGGVNPHFNIIFEFEEVPSRMQFRGQGVVDGPTGSINKLKGAFWRADNKGDKIGFEATK